MPGHVPTTWSKTPFILFERAGALKQRSHGEQKIKVREMPAFPVSRPKWPFIRIRTTHQVLKPCFLAKNRFRRVPDGDGGLQPAIQPEIRMTWFGQMGANKQTPGKWGHSKSGVHRQRITPPCQRWTQASPNWHHPSQPSTDPRVLPH